MESLLAVVALFLIWSRKGISIFKMDWSGALKS